MANQKDPDITKLTSQVERLEKIVQLLSARLTLVERENKRLKGAVGRATDHVGTLERRIPRK